MSIENAQKPPDEQPPFGIYWWQKEFNAWYKAEQAAGREPPAKAVWTTRASLVLRLAKAAREVPELWDMAHGTLPWQKGIRQSHTVQPVFNTFSNWWKMKNGIFELDDANGIYFELSAWGLVLSWASGQFEENNHVAAYEYLRNYWLSEAELDDASQ